MKIGKGGILEKLTKSEFVAKCFEYRVEKRRSRQKLLDDYAHERAKMIRERKRRRL